jgi:hypothetical protein
MVQVIIIPSAKVESVSCVIFTFLASKSAKIEVKQAPTNNKLMLTNMMIFFSILAGVLFVFIREIFVFKGRMEHVPNIGTCSIIKILIVNFIVAYIFH